MLRFLHHLPHLALAVTAPLLAVQDVELAEEVPLNADQVVAELRNADVHVLVTLGERPALFTEAADEGYTVAVELAPPVMTIRQTDGLSPEGRRLRVEMRVAPTQQLVLRGTGLDVTLEPTPNAFDTPPPPVRGPRTRLVVEDSQVDVKGLPDVAVDAVASSVVVSDSRESLALDLRASSADVRGHAGEVTVTANDADVTLHDGGGGVAVALEGGSLKLEGGVGRLGGTADGANLTVNGWRGEVELTGSDNTFAGYAAGIEPSAWKLSGGVWQVVLEDVRGPHVDVETAGGRLDARRLEAGVRFVGRSRASADLTGVQGNAELKLTDGAEARLVDVHGTVDVQAEDAVLDLDGVDQLKLDATRSEVTVRGVRGIRQLQVNDSELTLDLDEGTLSDGAVTLLGETRANVTLPAPCALRLMAPAEHVDVVGCELVQPGRTIRTRPGETRPFVLAVTLSEGSVLEAEGR